MRFRLSSMAVRIWLRDNPPTQSICLHGHKDLATEDQRFPRQATQRSPHLPFRFAVAIVIGHVEITHAVVVRRMYELLHLPLILH